MCIKVIASQTWDVFLRHSVDCAVEQTGKSTPL